MGRKTTYDKRTLSVACSKLKTQLIKKVKQSELKEGQITKTFVFQQLAKKLNLTSSSSFWKPSFQYKEYLENWYYNLVVELKESVPQNDPNIKLNTSIETQCNNIDTQLLLKELKEKKSTIDSLLSIISTLRVENESLRLKKLPRLLSVDKIDILSEEINDTELEQLYQVVSNLYQAKYTP